MRYKDKCAYNPDRSLYECGKKSDAHIPHSTEKALYAIGIGGEYIEECHQRKVSFSFPYDIHGILPAYE